MKSGSLATAARSGDLATYERGVHTSRQDPTLRLSRFHQSVGCMQRFAEAQNVGVKKYSSEVALQLLLVTTVACVQLHVRGIGIKLVSTRQAAAFDALSMRESRPVPCD